MSSYDYIPPRKNARAGTWILLLLAGSTVCFITAALVPRFPIIPESVGLLLVMFSIQLVARYYALRYLYRISPMEDGSADFEVFTYRGGNKMQLICRVALSEITAAVPLCAENRKPPQHIRRYSYCPNMGKKEALVLSVTNGDGDCEILIEPDEVLTALFLRAAKENATVPTFEETRQEHEEEN